MADLDILSNKLELFFYFQTISDHECILHEPFYIISITASRFGHQTALSKSFYIFYFHMNLMNLLSKTSTCIWEDESTCPEYHTSLTIQFFLLDNVWHNSATATIFPQPFIVSFYTLLITGFVSFSIFFSYSHREINQIHYMDYETEQYLAKTFIRIGLR